MLPAAVPSVHLHGYSSISDLLYLSPGPRMSPSPMLQGPFGMPCNFLLTRHDILGKRKPWKYAFSNVMVRYGDRAVFL